MDPARKRTVRLVVALSAAVLLAVALAYTSFSASSEATTPAKLASAARPGESYQLTGRVQKGYEGSVPDPFREGREVIVTVRKGADGTFVGEEGSLITKCPSKFTKSDT
jgi:cytochrome c-type biogenesis protein CcmE